MHVAITGASSGIGEAWAREFSAAIAPIPGTHDYNSAKGGMAAASFAKFGKDTGWMPSGTATGPTRLVRRAVERKKGV
jgi:NAD(P)-dependent dehydrogenase (short-subunit alcohol dehydrogenase family)